MCVVALCARVPYQFLRGGRAINQPIVCPKQHQVALRRAARMSGEWGLEARRPAVKGDWLRRGSSARVCVCVWEDGHERKDMDPVPATKGVAGWGRTGVASV